MERRTLTRKRQLLEVESHTTAMHCSSRMIHSLDDKGGGSKRMTDSKLLFEQISSWADPKFSLKRVVENLKFKHAPDVTDLDQSIKSKYLEFHRIIAEEYGIVEKQHSWAVLEKPEEVVIHGPYYTDYTEEIHSEEKVVEKIQELLQSELGSEDRKVYIFTANSPCLTRDTEPCMLNMVEMARAWWREFGVKTFIGFQRYWGFKGNKETLFQDLNYGQVDCLSKTQDYSGYVELAKKKNMIPICQSIYDVVKNLLESDNLTFTISKDQDLKLYFKNISSHFVSVTNMEKTESKQEVDPFNKAAQLLLTEEGGSFHDHLQRGNQQFKTMLFDSSSQDQVLFEERWRELVQDKYAESLRKKLTEDLNQRTVQLFIDDIAEFTKEYLQIGRIQFQ